VNKKVLIVEDQFVEANDLQLMLRKAGYDVCGIARSVPIAQEMIKKEKPGLVLLDIFLKGNLTGIDLARELGEENIAFVFLSANSNEEVLNQAKATQPYGFLVKPFREKDLLVTLEIAHYRHEHSLESDLKRENILKDKLSAYRGDPDSLEQRVLHICKTLQPYIPFDYATAGFNAIKDNSSQGLSFLRIGYDEYQMIGIPELLNITRLSIKELVALANKTPYDASASIFNEDKFEELCQTQSLNKLFSNTFEVNSYISIPLSLSNGAFFIFCFYSRKSDGYHANHLALLSRLQKAITADVESALSVRKELTSSSSLKTKYSEPVRNIQGTAGFEGIIGSSHLLLNVFDLITQVASSDTSVLILGESGTGKERIADCIHNLSPRKNGPLVKVNCATLPSTLIESELFGHEKGSFTGAHDKRVGKFEKADKGTIFLDEIGEMPVDLQVKLLRVLQERYIERIGAKDVTKVDVRVIAATNRKLEREVAEGRFRLDLYYRLNVFPIELPPLRERIEDLPALSAHFISIYNRKAGKKITGLSDKAIKDMMAYSWPGNIRELENVIERGVLLARGTTIEDILLPANQTKDISSDSTDFRTKTIHENERDYIIAVLKKCNGRIWGAGGAAELLGIPPTTLKSKMKKLSIQKQYME